MNNEAGITQARFGSFVVDGILATGTMSRLYRASDARRGGQVAIKTAIAAENYEPLRREAALLQRLQQDRVAKIVDAGEEDGIPWYAMEHIQGATLEAHWSSRNSLDVDRWLDVLARLCEPLSRLHAAGLVHRDLKPANIVIDEQGAPHIVDFGLAQAYVESSGRDQLIANPEMAGTYAYMSPEQLMGSSLDPRSDIFAFGCLLYEAVTGHRTFPCSTPEEIQARLTSEFQPLNERSPTAPAWLVEVVHGMLTMSAAHRTPYLADVQQELARQGYGDSGTLELSPNLYRPRFVGRERQFSEVQRLVKGAQTGESCVVFLSGESGIGKTRIVNEACQFAAARHFNVVVSGCKAVGTDTTSRVHGRPLYPFRELLGTIFDYCAERGAEATNAILGGDAKVLAPYDERIRFVPGFDALPEPDSLGQQATGQRALRALANVIRRYSRESPLLIAIDDLQWADEMTLEWLEHFGPSTLDESRLALLATYRSDEKGEGIRRLEAVDRYHRLEIDRLSNESIQRFLGDVLATDMVFPRQLVDLVRRESEGIPFFVFEYLRHAVESKLIYRSQTEWQYDASTASSLPMPSTVRELLERRIGTLGNRASMLSRVAAVIGREFALEDLADITGEEVLDQVLELEGGDIVEPVASRYRFSHDKLREIAYEQLEPAEATSLHRKRAESIEGRQPELGEHAAELAFHWRSAGEQVKALDYYVMGGEFAHERGAHADAYQLLSEAIAIDEKAPRHPELTAKIHRLMAAAAFNTSNLNESIDHSYHALSALGEKLPRSPIDWLAYTLGELARLARWYATSARSVRFDQRTYDATAAREQLALSLFYQCNNVESVCHLLGAFRSAAEIGAKDLQIDPCARIGFLSESLRLHRLSGALFQRAYGLSADLGSRSNTGLTKYMEAEKFMAIGEWSTCQTLAMESADLFEQIGDPQEAEMGWAIACNGFQYGGDNDNAREMGTKILKSAELRNHQIHIGWGEMMEARTLQSAGDHESALALLRSARSRMLGEPDLLSLIMCEGNLAKSLVRMGAPDDELRSLRDGLFTKLTATRRPMVPQCIDGYDGLLLASLHCLAADRQQGDERIVRDSLRALRAFSLVFPMARISYLRFKAAFAGMTKGPRQQRKYLTAARQLATERHATYWLEEMDEDGAQGW